MLIAMAGLPASGKSVLATAIQRDLDAVILDKDQLRSFLFNGHVDYSDEQNDLCVDVSYKVAIYLLTRPSPPTVILDGRTYSKTYQVEALKRAAAAASCPLFIIECVCSESMARERLEQDKGVHPAQDRDFNLYLKSRAAAQAILEPKLTVRTDQDDLERCKEQVLQYLAAAT